MGTSVSETAFKALPIWGNGLYQQRARLALPILIRQARSEKPISYKDLADELNMSHPRTLNWPLGSVGATIDALAVEKNWHRPQPPHIQSLVINKRDGMPGAGFDAFLSARNPNYVDFKKDEKRKYLKGYWSDIYAYSYWDDVLHILNLPKAIGEAPALIERAKLGRSGGGGEGPEHANLKETVRKDPTLVNLSRSIPAGRTEAPLPSGDKIDVLFNISGNLLAVEVKSRISNDADITRGLFQCVKYKAVMEAERGALSQNYNVDAVLVLGRQMPKGLETLRNSLGISVFVVE
jgi:hypothetical protein